MTKMLSSLIACALALTACGGKIPSPDPAPAAPTLSFSVSELALNPHGGESSVRLEASAAWSVVSNPSRSLATVSLMLNSM